jgi:3-hydroxymyristoyl/3-hydroxydecanoyl-(acyl carrier protein) dehydratase
MKVMPHRYPLLVAHPGTGAANGSWASNVSINEPFFVGHFPGHPIMPAVRHRSHGPGRRRAADEQRGPPETKLVYFSGIDGAVPASGHPETRSDSSWNS